MAQALANAYANEYEPGGYHRVVSQANGTGGDWASYTNIAHHPDGIGGTTEFFAGTLPKLFRIEPIASHRAIPE